MPRVLTESYISSESRDNWCHLRHSLERAKGMPRSRKCLACLFFLLIACASSPALVLPRLGTMAPQSDQTTSQWWWKGGPGEDSEEEITVFVPIADDVEAKDVTGQLWKDIRADESGWLIDKEADQRCIIITLIKRDAGRL
eukprot:s1814_g6.t1